MTASWVVPVASLGAICVVGILFIWWWFPRTWRKGTQQEAEIRKAEFTPEDRTWAKQVIARAEAKARGEAVGEMPARTGRGDLETGRAPPAYDAPPPVYS